VRSTFIRSVRIRFCNYCSCMTPQPDARRFDVERIKSVRSGKMLRFTELCKTAYS
jgi:hypothetical protein